MSVNILPVYHPSTSPNLFRCSIPINLEGFIKVVRNHYPKEFVNTFWEGSSNEKNL